MKLKRQSYGTSLVSYQCLCFLPALHADDAEWAQGVCEQLASHPNENVRGNAILGFGHIARINRKLDQAKVKPLIEAALRDDSEYVRAQAEAAADDVEFFLQWRLKR